jgi:RNA polymerase sigma factor (sigma-70 family)
MPTPSTATDAELLAAHLSGDPAALPALVARHHPLVAGACRRALPGADADDAVQAVFLVLLRKAAAARGHPCLPAWLHHAAVRVCAHARRARARRERAERAAATAMHRDPHDLPPAEALAHLDEALGELPEHERRPVILHHLQGLGLRETAAALGVGENTCASRIRRGLIRLRERLARRGYAVGAAGVAVLFTQAAAAEAPAPAAFAATIKAGGTAAGRALATGASSMSTVLMPLILTTAVTGIAGGGLVLGGGAGDGIAGGSTTAATAAAMPAATGPGAGTRPRAGGTAPATTATLAEPPLGGSIDIDSIRIRAETGPVRIAVGDAGSRVDATTPPCLLATWTSRDGSAAMWLGLDSTRPELVPATVAAAVRGAHPLPATWMDAGIEPPAAAPDGWICVALVSSPAGAGWSHRAALVPASAVLAAGSVSISGAALIQIIGEPLPGSAALVNTATLRARLRAQPGSLIRPAN